MSSTDTHPVRRRQVFYIPGYDPIPPRRYRELYRTQSAEQAAISGYEISQTPRQVGGRFGWHVEATIDGQVTQADFAVLLWSDIVRDSMGKGVFGTYLLLLRTAWTYITSGALFRLMRLRKGPVIAALYPVVFLLVQALLALALALTLTFGLAWILGIAAENIGLQANESLFNWVHLGTLVIGLLAGWGLLRWFKARDAKFFAYYLMHDYAYSAQCKGANPPELEARMAKFTAEISEALTQGSDEVLVVGHSSGAHLGVSILADLFRAGHVPDTGPALSFLSLGQVVPMVSFLPDAQRLRADLAYLCRQDGLTWIDVTAPGDGCAFALCDPVSVTGVAPKGKRWPLVLSAAFTQTLSPERWKELRWRFFRLHFQYLCAFDRPGDYDYFQITAGPQTLGERYRGRAPSKSRIETPRSGYRDMAP